MEETKKINQNAVRSEIICTSKKHWSSYIFPILFILIGLFIFILGYFGITKNIYLIIIGLLLSIRYLNKILAYKSTMWILTKEDLTIKSGFLPWAKTHLEIPIEDIYDSYYQFGFFAKILGYGHLNIRRTEGSTSSFVTTQMTNCDLMTATINSEVLNLKKNANKMNYSTNISVADELIKLNDLLEKGVINKEEFDFQKNKILNR
ncbi:MAG: hypothetical protein KGV44_13685 [Flavobacteriaceae bacterium]|nr:hypothetical protein [Flavobacteriaceae bacterium]